MYKDIENKSEKENNKKINNNKDKANNIKFVFLAFILIILIAFSSLYIYLSLNKESGIYSIFSGAKKGELKSEEAANISQKYIEAICNKKVKDFNILREKDKYYFYSSIADVVLDKTNGKTYFDRLTTKDEFKGKAGFIQKEEEILKQNNENMDKFIYLNIKQAEKTDEESVVDATKKMIFKFDSKKMDITNEEKKNIEDKVENINNLQSEFKDLLKTKKEIKEKNEDSKEVEDRINRIKEEMDKKLNELDFNGLKLNKVMKSKIDKNLFLINKETEVKEGNYTNSNMILDSLILGYIDEDNILVLKDNFIYVFKKMDNNEYFEYIENMKKDIYDKVSKIKSLIFTAKDFSKYIYNDELEFSKDYNKAYVYFYLHDTGVINRKSYIKMEINLKNKEIIDIEVKINTIPYSEVKIDMYTASKIAYRFLKQNNYIKATETEKTDIEYIDLEIDSSNTFYKKDVKPAIEKMWKVKFKDINEVVFIDSYYGVIIGGKK